MNMQFRELAALYSFFFYDNVENQSKYPIKFAIFNEEVAKAFPAQEQQPKLENWKVLIDGRPSMWTIDLPPDLNKADIQVRVLSNTNLQTYARLKCIKIHKVSVLKPSKEIKLDVVWDPLLELSLVGKKVGPVLTPCPLGGAIKLRDAND